MTEHKLAPCPCGKTPKKLLIADNGSKWAYAYGDCCNEWHIEFRTQYNPLDSEACQLLAVEAWNLASRETVKAEETVCKDELLPEWYSMAREFFVEIGAYSTPMYEEMNGQTILTQLRYAAEREQRTLILRKKIYSIFEIAKEHQKRYNEMTEQEYWKGRRDEAGWLADELLKIIEVR